MKSLNDIYSVIDTGFIIVCLFLTLSTCSNCNRSSKLTSIKRELIELNSNLEDIKKQGVQHEKTK